MSKNKMTRHTRILKQVMAFLFRIIKKVSKRIIKKVLKRIIIELRCIWADMSHIPPYIEERYYPPSFYIRYTPEEQREIIDRDVKMLEDLLEEKRKELEMKKHSNAEEPVQNES